MLEQNILTVPYTEKTYADLVAHYEEQGLRLVGIQNITEGNFLVFRNAGEPLPTIETRLEALESAMLDMLLGGASDV